MPGQGKRTPRTRSEANLVWAIGNFLGYAQDQLTHLQPGSEVAALYVGRRLDQAWRALEWWGMEWLEQNDAHLVLARVHGPTSAQRTAVAESSFDAIASPEGARRFLTLAREAVAHVALTPVSIASGLWAARLHFSAYRLEPGWVSRSPGLVVSSPHWWERTAA